MAVSLAKQYWTENNTVTIMKKIAEHAILLSGNSLQSCCEQVQSYFAKTTLVRYDSLKIIADKSVCGTASTFQESLARGVEKNGSVISGLISELEKTGIEKISQLQQLQQGYPSKTLHLLSHFIDGFISIDSAFYNLVDDSHNIPAKTAEEIQRNPEQYWIIVLEGYSVSPEKAALLPMHL